MKKRILFMMALSTAVMALSGCGGGGGGDAGPIVLPTDTVISGVATAGPINGGKVDVFAVAADGTVGVSALKTGATGSDGSYNINMGTFTGAVLVKVTGGTYRDEATLTTKNLATEAGNGMRSVIAGISAGSTTVVVTPLTELAVQKAGTLTPANIGTANTAVGTFFNVGNIVTTVPIDATVAPPALATDGQKAYAVAVAAVSQLQKDRATTLGDLLTSVGAEMTASSGMSAATLNDINTATTSFLISPNNRTGLTTVPVIKPSAGVLKLSTVGSLVGTSLIGVIDVTVTLPAGVTIKTLPGGIEPLAGVVTISGVAATASGATINATIYTPPVGSTPASLRFVIGNTAIVAGAPSGFSVGDFVTINCDLATSAVFPTADKFIFPSLSVLEGQGTSAAPLTGITAAATFNAVVQ